MVESVHAAGAVGEFLRVEGSESAEHFNIAIALLLHYNIQIYSATSFVINSDRLPMGICIPGPPPVYYQGQRDLQNGRQRRQIGQMEVNAGRMDKQQGMMQY